MLPRPPCWASQVVLVVKNLSANAGDTRDTGLILGLGRSPREENGNLLHYSCQNNLRIAAGFSIVFGKYKYSSKMKFSYLQMCSKREMRQRNGNWAQGWVVDVRSEARNGRWWLSSHTQSHTHTHILTHSHPYFCSPCTSWQDLSLSRTLKSKLKRVQWKIIKIKRKRHTTY